MIRNKEDLKYYLGQDTLALHQCKNKPGRQDAIWKYEIILRKREYYTNKENKSIFDRIMLRYYAVRHHKLSIRYTTNIPVNVCGPGLSIAHLGTIYVNSNSKIGKNLRIQSGVTIGGSKGEYPVLGDNIYIGSGAKIIGGITVADNVAIGANAVVVKDITEPGTTHAGNPSRLVSQNDSHLYIDNRLD